MMGFLNLAQVPPHRESSGLHQRSGQQPGPVSDCSSVDSVCLSRQSPLQGIAWIKWAAYTYTKIHACSSAYLYDMLVLVVTQVLCLKVIFWQAPSHDVSKRKKPSLSKFSAYALLISQLLLLLMMILMVLI